MAAKKKRSTGSKTKAQPGFSPKPTRARRMKARLGDRSRSGSPGHSPDTMHKITRRKRKKARRK
jgi:hypothetical protein